MRAIDFDDLFLYFSNPKHRGVRHKARELGVHHSALHDLYNEYLRSFWGDLPHNPPGPRYPVCHDG